MKTPSSSWTRSATHRAATWASSIRATGRRSRLSSTSRLQVDVPAHRAFTFRRKVDRRRTYSSFRPSTHLLVDVRRREPIEFARAPRESPSHRTSRARARHPPSRGLDRAPTENLPAAPRRARAPVGTSASIPRAVVHLCASAHTSASTTARACFEDRPRRARAAPSRAQTPCAPPKTTRAGENRASAPTSARWPNRHRAGGGRRRGTHACAMGPSGGHYLPPPRWSLARR